MDPNAINEESPIVEETPVDEVGNPSVNDDTETTDTREDEGPDAGELAAGYLREADYTRKAQEAAHLKRQAARELAEALSLKEKYKPYEEFVGILDSDAELAEHVTGLMQQRGIRKPASDVDSDVRAELKEIKETLALQKTQGFIATFGQTANMVAEEYGLTQKEMQEIVAEGVADKVVGLHTAPEALKRVMVKLVRAAGYEKAKATATQELTSTLRNKAKMASPKGSGAVPAVREPDTSKMTDDERVAHMLSLIPKS